MAKEKNNKTVRAVFPGSFDPITNGHLDIVERSLAVFDEIVIGVLDNPSKEALLPTAKRVALIRRITKKFKGRVKVQSFSGLLVSFVKRVEASVVIRGLRAISDFDYEAQMALMNRKLSNKVETFFLMSTEANSYISSTVVKQVAKFGGDISGMVPGEVVLELRGKKNR